MVASTTLISTAQERMSSKGSIPATPVAGPSTPTPAQTPTTSIQTRQKRILPSRSRRGGPGVGSCDADVMILDTLKRKHENEPLIPADTRLLLTTKSELAPSTSSGVSFELQLNTSAYDRYFDKPEVLKAYREQLIIQTPEFTTLPEHATVGGRFRPRGHVEEESADTSDAAYEKRHRKYETFEKRQRLREKEKLKHEHYKLKERIDQLRAMDASGFLTIPDLAPESVSDEKPVSYSSDSTAREAERRKDLMLECAHTLEARYRTLLNPDHGRTIEKNGRQPSEATSVEPAGPSLKARGKGVQAEEESEEAEEEIDELDESEPEVKPAPPQEKLKLRIRWPAGMGRSTASAPPKPSSPKNMKGKGVARKSLPARRTATPDAWESADEEPVPSRYGTVYGTSISAPGPPRKGGRPRASNGTFLPAGAVSVSSTEVRPRKRRRRLSSVGSADDEEDELQSPSTTTHSRSSRRQPCQLVICAYREADASAGRRGNRRRPFDAFGVRIPQELEQVRDFELPHWLQHPGSPMSSQDYGHFPFPYDGSSATYARSDVAVEEILS